MFSEESRRFNAGNAYEMYCVGRCFCRANTAAARHEINVQLRANNAASPYPPPPPSPPPSQGRPLLSPSRASVDASIDPPTQTVLLWSSSSGTMSV